MREPTTTWVRGRTRKLGRSEIGHRDQVAQPLDFRPVSKPCKKTDYQIGALSPQTCRSRSLSL